MLNHMLIWLGDSSVARATSTPSMSEIRIEWKIGESCGGGCWTPESPTVVARMERAIGAMNLEWGPGTHWIARRRA